MPTLEILLYVLPKWERHSAVPTGILVRLFPGSRHHWLSDRLRPLHGPQCYTPHPHFHP
jgi:hypothetical protein